MGRGRFLTPRVTARRRSAHARPLLARASLGIESSAGYLGGRCSQEVLEETFPGSDSPTQNYP